MSTSPWLVSWSPGPEGLPVLLCLAPAGAGCGQYRTWQTALAPGIAVMGGQLPGREERWDDPPVADFDEAVERIATAFAARLAPGARFAVFGHSFGGLLGHEIVHRLAGEHGLRASVLAVAACRPPRHWLGAGQGLMDDRAGLDRLLTDGPATVAALARAEDVRPQSMRVTLAALEERGMVQRSPHATDQRQVLLSVTPEVEQQLAVVRTAKEDWLARSMADKLSRAEQDSLLAAIPLLRRLLEP